MRQVYLAGHALISTLGPDLPSALARLGKSPSSLTPSSTVILTNTSGESCHWPYYAIDLQHSGSWLERALTLIQAAVAQLKTPPDHHVPLLIGTTSGDLGAFETDPAFEQDCRRFARQIAERLQWQGPVCTVSTACTSSLNALISAQRRIATGATDNALVLGIELFNCYTMRGFAGMQLLSPHRPLPFGSERDGLVLGEAIAVLYLSATPQRWHLNAGVTHVDGSDPTGTNTNAIISLYQQILVAAGLPATDIDLIKIQAAGSPQNDSVEAGALRQIFSTLPPLVSFKAALGHTLGASGAAELALLLACLENGVWPTVPYAIDPALKATLTLSLPASVRNIVHAVYGFGGGYAALALKDREAR